MYQLKRNGRIRLVLKGKRGEEEQDSENNI